MTQPNICLIGEEIAAKNSDLTQIVEEASIIVKRAEGNGLWNRPYSRGDC